MNKMKSVSAAEMKEIERVADSRGLSYRQMMENAGTAAFEAMRKNWPEARNIVIFTGKGNNGGDGFVAARLFEAEGGQVTVVLCEGEPKTADAKYNYERILQLENIRITDLDKLTSEDDSLTALKEESAAEAETTAELMKNAAETEIAAKFMKNADLIVDALYGTGFHGELRERGRRAAELMNGASAPVCALDLPSGMNADTGDIADGAVKADLTVVFHRRKHGHDAENAKNQCGRILVVPIGIDNDSDVRS